MKRNYSWARAGEPTRKRRAKRNPGVLDFGSLAIPLAAAGAMVAYSMTRKSKRNPLTRRENPFVVVANDHRGHGSQQIGRRFRTRREALAYERKLAHDPHFYASALGIRKVDPRWYERLGRSVRRALKPQRNPRIVGRAGKGLVFRGTQAQANAYARAHGLAAPVAVGLRTGSRV